MGKEEGEGVCVMAVVTRIAPHHM